MSERVVHQRVVRDDVGDDRVTTVDEHPQNVADRLIWFVAGVILVLLAFRFIMALLGAANVGFAHFIFSVSHPFVAPFFGIFHYSNLTYGVSRVEIYTLFAMLVYAVIAWGLNALVDISRR